MSTKFFLVSNKVKKFKKSIEVDGDKSISIRWLLLASQITGISKAQNLLRSEDVHSAIECLRKLGIKIKRDCCKRRFTEKEYKITSENLIPLYNEVMDLLYNFNNFEFSHIKRKLNHHADALANQAIDDFTG